MSNFSNIPTYYHRWLPSTKKWWNYSLRWPPLGSEIIPLSPALCREVFLMLETVCRNHCTMGWPWDGRHRIISSTPIRWDGAHLSSAGVRKNSSATRNPPPQPPQLLDIWWSKVTLHPVWQHNIVSSTKLNQRVLSGSSDYYKNSPMWIFMGWWHVLLKGHRGQSKVTS